MYHRLVTNTHTWVRGEPWPTGVSLPLDPKTGKQANPASSDPLDQFKVGEIFFEAAVTDAVSIDGDRPNETIYAGDNEVTPAYYEVWCVTDRLMLIIQQILKTGEDPDEQALEAALTRNPIMTVEIAAGSVKEAYKSWRPDLAFKRLFDQIVAEKKQEKEDAEEMDEKAEDGKNGQKQQQAARAGA